jgi:hypothetical protein
MILHKYVHHWVGLCGSTLTSPGSNVQTRQAQYLCLDDYDGAQKGQGQGTWGRVSLDLKRLGNGAGKSQSKILCRNLEEESALHGCV